LTLVFVAEELLPLVGRVSNVGTKGDNVFGGALDDNSDVFGVG
jgi:hypothetical protein